MILDSMLKLFHMIYLKQYSFLHEKKSLNKLNSKSAFKKISKQKNLSSYR